MKTTVTVLAIIFALLASPSFATTKPVQSVKVLSTKRYIFYYKVEKEIVGGTVQIFDASQTLIRTEKVTRIKNIVDFFELKAGIYTIKIKKGNDEFDFEYVNVQ